MGNNKVPICGVNPILWADYPDPDIIRVEDTYYMISTTMHLEPGALILRSYDLIHWEIASYVFDCLEDNDSHCLRENKNIYGKGMWAASIRYHKGMFYVCFVANDTHKTYLYTSSKIEGPWKKEEIEGFYHDSSLLFDDDGRVFIIYGNTEIHLTQLTSDLSAPLKGGIDKVIIKDHEKVVLGYEGSHFYKINGKYYVFMIHWLGYGSHRRVEACYVSDTVDGEYRGGNILDDDLEYHNAGVAQGGIVDTPTGEWYAMLFQDHGAVGRVPVLLPVTWEDDFPVFGEKRAVPKVVKVQSTHPDYKYKKLVDSDNFSGEMDQQHQLKLKPVWQWNHHPDEDGWSITEKKNCLTLHSLVCCDELEQARNTLTQRCVGPRCQAIVTLDGVDLKSGDYAGLTAFLGNYAFIALHKEKEELSLVMVKKSSRRAGAEIREVEWIPVSSALVTLKAEFSFEENKDEVSFFYKKGKEWIMLGQKHKMYYELDHFMGCRIGLFYFSTSNAGGTVEFSDFIYQ